MADQNLENMDDIYESKKREDSVLEENIKIKTKDEAKRRAKKAGKEVAEKTFEEGMKSASKTTGVVSKIIAFFTSPIGWIVGAVILVISIILIIMGVLAYSFNMPGLFSQNIQKKAMNTDNAPKSWSTDELYLQISEEQKLDVLNYIKDMGYDLVADGFVQGVTTDSEGNITGYADFSSLTGAFKDYIFWYIITSEGAYWPKSLVVNNNDSWFSNIVTSIGLINLQSDDISIFDSFEFDRENLTLSFTNTHGFFQKDKYVYNIDGWTGRYGKPLELLLALHISTMSPDFVYDFITQLDTTVNVKAEEVEFKLQFKYQNQSGDEIVYYDEEKQKIDLANYLIKKPDGTWELDESKVDELKESATISNLYRAMLDLTRPVMVDSTDIEIINNLQNITILENEIWNSIINNNYLSMISNRLDNIPNFTQFNDWFGQMENYSNKYICTLNTNGTVNKNNYFFNDWINGLSYEVEESDIIDDINILANGQYQLGALWDTYLGRYGAELIAEKLYGLKNIKQVLINREKLLTNYDNFTEDFDVKIVNAYKNQLQYIDKYIYRVIEQDTIDGVRPQYIQELNYNLDGYSSSNPETGYYYKKFKYWAEKLIEAEAYLKSIPTGGVYNSGYASMIESNCVLLDELIQEMEFDYTKIKSIQSGKVEGLEAIGLTDIDELKNLYDALSRASEYEEIKTFIPYITTVERHWYKDIDFRNSYEYLDSAESIISEFDLKDDDGNVVNTGEWKVYSILTPTVKADGTTDYITQKSQPYVIKGDIITLNDEIISEEEYNQSGLSRQVSTNYKLGDGFKITKKLIIEGMYYVYDGTPQTANQINIARLYEGTGDVYVGPSGSSTIPAYDPNNPKESGEAINNALEKIGFSVRRKNISFDNNNSLVIFSILEAMKTLDAEYAYRDLKEMFVDLGYFSRAELDSFNINVLDWFIPGYTELEWPPLNDEDVASFTKTIKSEKTTTEQGLEIPGFAPGLDIVAPASGIVKEKKGDSIIIEFDIEQDSDKPEAYIVNRWTLYIGGITVSNINVGDIVKRGDVIGKTTTLDIKLLLRDDRASVINNIEEYMVLPVFVIENDYDVRTESGVNVITSVAEFQKAFPVSMYQGNLYNNAEYFINAQNMYGINALFIAAVSIVESSGGTNWAANQPFTNNWFNITGSGGPYAIGSWVNPNSTNKLAWRMYESVEHGILDCGRLISEAYVTEGRYTVTEIGKKYNPGGWEPWAEYVSSLMTSAIERVSGE